MQRYVIRRLAQFIPVLITITFLVYSMILFLPGDPVLNLVAQSAGETAFAPEVVEQYRKELGLDKPVPIQYVLWVGRAAQGDFGMSVKTGRPVIGELKSRLPVTLQINIVATIVSLAIAFPAGVGAALFRNTIFDRLITAFAVSAVAVPTFWLALMLILFFSVNLRWLPVSGFESIFTDPWRAIQLMVLPVIMLGWEGAAVLTRQIRSAMLEVMNQDYVRTARAKGLPNSRVIWVHALRNAMLPIVTLLGFGIGGLLAGSVIAETIFAIPGVGRLFVSAIQTQDFPIVQALVLLYSTLTIVSILLTDLAYGWLDPRIRYD